MINIVMRKNLTELCTVFSGTIERVKKRVLMCGHNVEESTIRERFKKGVNFLFKRYWIFN